MNRPCSASMRERLDSTIQALCPVIEDRLSASEFHYSSEYDLRKELVGCILGSQVRHEMAVAATQNLEWAGLLDDVWWCGARSDGFDSRVHDVLTGQQHDLPRRCRYRFPKTRASQLTQARDVFARVPISSQLANEVAPKHLRQSLIINVPGLGPKQASMFLRNVGKSYDLAILDTHVLRFMVMQDLLPMERVSVGTVAGYERAERIVVAYANRLGYPVGYLDWAIWATMKAARELGL